MSLKGKVAIVLVALVIMVLAALFLSARNATRSEFGRVFSPLNERQIERIFNNDFEALHSIVIYLFNSEYDTLSINRGEQGIEKITDAEVIETIRRLGERGFQVIAKDRSVISFNSFAILSEVSTGIVFSVGRPTGNEIQFLTRLESFSEPNWYFFEADFNEWRARNR